jgi:hypothetical protein
MMAALRPRTVCSGGFLSPLSSSRIRRVVAGTRGPAASTIVVIDTADAPLTVIRLTSL